MDHLQGGRAPFFPQTVFHTFLTYGEKTCRLIDNAESGGFPEDGKGGWGTVRREGVRKQDGDGIAGAERMACHPDRAVIDEDAAFVE